MQQTTVENRLLQFASPHDFAALAACLESVPLVKGTILVDVGETIEHIYFPEIGILSIVATSPEGQEVEAGLFGRDGFGPIAAVLGSERSPYRILTQVAGQGHRIATRALIQASDRSASLRSLLLRYAQVISVQTTYTALSNAVHTVDERLARWLLMCHDRLATDDLPLTHEFLSIMLSVRRPSVTTALHVLEGNKFIHADRGFITIRNRKALEEFAGDAYGKPEAEYEQLIGPMNGQSLK